MHIATKSSKLDISAEEKTAQIAYKLSSILKKGDTVFLYGEIGVGKTTFVRYLINSYQKRSNLRLTEVTSPTFNLINEYEIKELKIHHYDLFRLSNDKDLLSIGLFENNEEILTLIEWPEKIKRKIKSSIDLYFNYEKELERRALIISGLDKKQLDGIK